MLSPWDFLRLVSIVIFTSRITSQDGLGQQSHWILSSIRVFFDTYVPFVQYFGPSDKTHIN